MMIKNIAVAVTGVDRVKHVPADLINSAEPGSSVDLLIRTKARRAVWMQAQLTALSTHDSTALKFCEQQFGLEVESEQNVAERSCAPLRAALAGKDVELRIHIYAGSLRKALRDLVEIRGGPYVVMRARKDCSLLEALRAKLTTLGLFKPVQSVEFD